MVTIFYEALNYEEIEQIPEMSFTTLLGTNISHVIYYQKFQSIVKSIDRDSIGFPAIASSSYCFDWKQLFEIYVRVETKSC